MFKYIPDVAFPHFYFETILILGNKSQIVAHQNLMTSLYET